MAESLSQMLYLRDRISDRIVPDDEEFPGWIRLYLWGSDLERWSRTHGPAYPMMKDILVPARLVESTGSFARGPTLLVRVESINEKTDPARLVIKVEGHLYLPRRVVRLTRT